MNNLLDTQTFQRQLLRHLILRVLSKAFEYVHVICEEGYFDGQNLTHELQLMYEENARYALWATKESLESNIDAVDMTILQFIPKHKKNSVALLKDIEYELQLGVFRQMKFRLIRDIIECTPERFKVLQSEFEKRHLYIPIAFLAIYRARNG